MADARVNLRTSADLAAIHKMDAAFRDLSAAEQRAAREALQTASAFARLDAAMGQPAQGAARLRATLDGLGAGSARQVAGIEAQIARLNDTTQKGASYGTQFGDALKGQLLGIVGPAAAASVALKAVTSGIEAGRSALALRETQNSLRAVAGDARTYSEVLATAREQQVLFGGTLQENIEGLTGLTITSRQSGASLKQLIDLSQRLAVLDPAQGAAGARIALSEALSGDPTSLAKRYEIPKAALRALRDESVSTADKLLIISQYLDKVGISSDAVSARVDRTAKFYRELGAAAESAKNFIGGGLADAPANFSLNITGQNGFAGVITGIQGIGSAMSGLAPPINTTTDANERMINSFLRFIGIQKEITNTAPIILQSADAADRAAEANARLAQEARAGALSMDEERQAAAGLQIATGLAATDIQRSAEASILDAAQKDLQQQKTALLAQETQNTVNAFLQLNPGIDASAAASLAAAQGYSPQIAQLAAIAIEAENARAALNRMTLEANLAKGAFQNAAAARAAAGDHIGPATGPSSTLGKGLGAGGGSDTRVLDEANRVRQAQNQLALAQARSAQQRIAILEREKGQTTDVATRLRIQAQIEQERNSLEKSRASATKAHTGELQKQLTLNERIYDSINKQNIARLDVQLKALDDERKRLDEANEIAAAQRVVNSGEFSEDQKARARIELARIPLEQQKRQLEIAEEAATAGGAIVNGRILQSQAGGAPAPAPAGATVQGGAPGGGEVAIVQLDGKQVGAVLAPHLFALLRSGRAQVTAAGG